MTTNGDPMTTTGPGYERPSGWAHPERKICRGEDCTATLAASDPDLCEKCDIHGNVGDVRSLLVQILVELRAFPATADVPVWASQHPLRDQTISRLAQSLLQDVKAVRAAVESYSRNAEADRVRLAEHEQIAAGLRRAAAFLFGEQA
jgi:hypothetical protein